MTGLPRAMASRITRPKGSGPVEAWTTTWHAAMAEATSVS